MAVRRLHTGSPKWRARRLPPTIALCFLCAACGGMWDYDLDGHRVDGTRDVYAHYPARPESYPIDRCKTLPAAAHDTVARLDVTWEDKAQYYNNMADASTATWILNLVAQGWATADIAIEGLKEQARRAGGDAFVIDQYDPWAECHTDTSGTDSCHRYDAYVIRYHDQEAVRPNCNLPPSWSW